MRAASLCLCMLFTLSGTVFGSWTPLAPGLDLENFQTSAPFKIGDPCFIVLRIDPKRWDLVCVGVNGSKESMGKTAKQWSQAHKLTAAINAGMFAKDYKTHVGYMKIRDRFYNSKVNKYKSVVAFDPRRRGLPRFRMFDLDSPKVTIKRIVRDYASAVQNLRLIKRPKQNRWPQQDKKWSEAALGEDKAGRILFIYCRSPMTMHDLNHKLLRLRIGLVCAQHLEGGPPAQLYVRVGDKELDLCGSYETSIQENDGNVTPWRIPHVLGVRPR